MLAVLCFHQHASPRSSGSWRRSVTTCRAPRMLTRPQVASAALTCPLKRSWMPVLPVPWCRTGPERSRLFCRHPSAVFWSWSSLKRCTLVMTTHSLAPPTTCCPVSTAWPESRWYAWWSGPKYFQVSDQQRAEDRVTLSCRKIRDGVDVFQIKDNHWTLSASSSSYFPSVKYAIALICRDCPK